MSAMKKTSFAVLAGALALLLVVQVSLVSERAGAKLLAWDAMVGVPSGLTGAQARSRSAGSTALGSRGRSPKEVASSDSTVISRSRSMDSLSRAAEATRRQCSAR